RPAMAPAPPVQRETIRLAAILVAVRSVLAGRIMRLLGRLRRSATRDEGRQAFMGAFAVLVLLRARLVPLFLRLAIALLARLIILIVVARREWLRVLRQIRLRLADGVRRLERLHAVVFAVLELALGARLLELLLIAAAFRARLEIRILLAELLLRGSDQAEIVLGMLQIIFRRNRIAGGL